MRVEVQIRTMAMDFWASLDHQMKYKKDLDDSGEISEELKECAEIIAQTDLKMQSIRQKIENRANPPIPFQTHPDEDVGRTNIRYCRSMQSVDLLLPDILPVQAQSPLPSSLLHIEVSPPFRQWEKQNRSNGG